MCIYIVVNCNYTDISPNNDYNIMNVMTDIRNNYYLIFFIVFIIVYN